MRNRRIERLSVRSYGLAVSPEILNQFKLMALYQSMEMQARKINKELAQKRPGPSIHLDARFRNPPIGGFKHVECLCGTPGIVSLLKTWFFQLCIIASTLFWSNSMDTFNGLIVLRIHF